MKKQNPVPHSYLYYTRGSKHVRNAKRQSIVVGVFLSIVSVGIGCGVALYSPKTASLASVPFEVISRIADSANLKASILDTFNSKPAPTPVVIAEPVKPSAEKPAPVVEEPIKVDEVQMMKVVENNSDTTYVALDPLALTPEQESMTHPSFAGIKGKDWNSEIGTIIDRVQPERTDFYLKRTGIKKSEDEVIGSITTPSVKLGSDYYLFQALTKTLGSEKKAYKMLDLMSRKGFNVDRFEAGDTIRIEDGVFVVQRANKSISN